MEHGRIPELVEIKKLKLIENNPRKITKQQMEKLCKSIESDPGFLWSRPILVNDKDGELIVYGGNQRVRAAKTLKWKEIPCIIESISDEVMKERVIKDNKTFGEFDFDMLAGEYDISSLLDCGFIMSELGIMEDLDEVTEHSVEEIDSKGKDKDEEKKLIMCPFCGEEF